MSTTAQIQEPDVLAGPDVASRVVRGGVARTVGFVVVNLLGVAGSVVLLRYLGVAEYGRYGTVLALVAIVTGLSDAGLTITGARELSLLPRGAQRRRLLGAILGGRLLLSTLAVLGAVAFAAIAGYDHVLVLGTVLAGMGAILVGAQAAMTTPLVVELRNGLLTVSEIVRQVILFVGIVALVAVGASLAPFFAVQIAVGAGGLLIVPFLVHRSYLTRPTLSREDWRRLAVTAFPVAVASVLTVLYVRLLVVFSSLLTSAYQTGLFVTSARITEMLGGLALLLSGVILPVATVAARDDRGRLRYVLVNTTKVSLLVGGLLSLVVAVAAHPIVVLLGGHAFAPAASVVRLQAPMVLTIFLVYPWTSFLIADGRRRDLAARGARCRTRRRRRGRRARRDDRAGRAPRRRRRVAGPALVPLALRPGVGAGRRGRGGDPQRCARRRSRRGGGAGVRRGRARPAHRARRADDPRAPGG